MCQARNYGHPCNAIATKHVETRTVWRVDGDEDIIEKSLDLCDADVAPVIDICRMLNELNGDQSSRVEVRPI